MLELRGGRSRGVAVQVLRLVGYDDVVDVYGIVDCAVLSYARATGLVESEACGECGE